MYDRIFPFLGVAFLSLLTTHLGRQVVSIQRVHVRQSSQE